jgi:TBC1 domain family member 2
VDIFVFGMAARPPPTRPHIGLNPSSHFSYSITEWGEDDAWDSASDSESTSNSQSAWVRPSQQHPAPHPSRPSAGGGIGATSSAPKAVPRKSPQNSSSSTLAFSYTHVSAPSPPPGGGSSSSHTDSPSLVPATPHAKNGWTIVQKESADGIVDDRSSPEPHDFATSDREGVDMTFEDLGEELVDMPLTASAAAKSRLDAACIRQDAAEIMSGTQRCFSLKKKTSSRSSCVLFPEDSVFIYS